MNEFEITSLYIYPVKSLGGIQLSESEVHVRGLKYDRRWMIVDQNNQFITQRTHRRMALIKTSLTKTELLLLYNGEQRAIPLMEHYGEKVNVQVWQSNCEAELVNAEINNWLSEIIELPVKLVYMPDTTKRRVNPEYAIAEDIVGFADAYPILLISEESLIFLNSKLENSIPMNRFRPNIVFKGGIEHQEDLIKDYQIGDCRFRNVKPCYRCVVTTIDQTTIERSKEPLKTLSTYRMANQEVWFGMNSIPISTGSIRVGDKLQIDSYLDKKLSFSG